MAPGFDDRRRHHPPSGGKPAATQTLLTHGVWKTYPGSETAVPSGSGRLAIRFTQLGGWNSQRRQMRWDLTVVEAFVWGQQGVPRERQRRLAMIDEATQAGEWASGQPGLGWTLVLRRQPTRIVDGRPQGGYSDAFELICCDCGDDPDLDYHHVSVRLQQIRGPYPVAAGIAVYEKHARHHRRQAGGGRLSPR